MEDIFEIRSCIEFLANDNLGIRSGLLSASTSSMPVRQTRLSIVGIEHFRLPLLIAGPGACATPWWRLPSSLFSNNNH